MPRLQHDDSYTVNRLKTGWDEYRFPEVFFILVKPLISSFILSAVAFLLPAFLIGGCASKDEIAAQRKWETYDERASREVFRSNWIVPSVSEEDKNFFYRPFFKVSNER